MRTITIIIILTMIVSAILFGSPRRAGMNS
jgi:hypothetical protein